MIKRSLLALILLSTPALADPNSIPANEIMASPSGAAGPLSPRALTILDLPALAFSNLTGNIAVGQMNSGTGASSSTYWRGDGTWASVPSGGLVSGTTTVTGTCTTGQFLYNNAGILACQTLAGGGNVSNTGTPTSGQLAVWTSSTAIQGVSTLPAALLPNPSATTPGGVLSSTAATNQFATGISTSGIITYAQPSFANLAGSATNAQLPTSVSLSGTLVVTGATSLTSLSVAPAAGLTSGLSLSQSITGSSSSANGIVYNYINVASDNGAANGTPSNAFGTTLSVQNLNFGGAAATGGRMNLTSQLVQTAATSSSSTFRDYVALQGYINSSSGDGGGAGTEKGNYFAGWLVADLGASATHVGALQGLEIDLSAAAGSSTLHKSGLLVGHSVSGGISDSVAGSINDNLIWLAGCGAGCVSSAVGIQFGRTDTAAGYGVSTTGSLIATKGAGTVGIGIDMTATTFATASIWVPGFFVDPAGNAQMNTAKTAGATTATLPTCNAAEKGFTDWVSNGQSSPPFLGAVSTTGTTIAPVFCNGTVWVYG